jgi:hypothetical protein
MPTCPQSRQSRPPRRCGRHARGCRAWCPADARVADRAAVDGAVRADLDIVADLDPAQRMDARPALRRDLALIAQRSRAPASTPDFSGVTKEKPSEPTTAPGCAMKRRRCAPARRSARRRAAAPPRPVPPRPRPRHAPRSARPARSARRPDHHEGADGRAVADLGRGVDHGGGVDAGGDVWPGVERAGDPGHRVARPRHDERGLQPQRPPVRPAQTTATRARPCDRPSANSGLRASARSSGPAIAGSAAPLTRSVPSP